jgi:hypothetical protein
MTFPEQDFFLGADAALAAVVDRLTPAQLELAAPAEWTRRFTDPTLAQIVLVHAHDESFVPDVLAGRTLEEVGDRWEPVLEQTDALDTYREAYRAATDAASTDLDPAATVHFSYGDYPLAEAVTHLAMYRGQQAWQIARLVGDDGYHLPEDVVAGFERFIVPNAETWRQWGVFPPAIEPAAGADRETRMLNALGVAVS